MSYLAWLSRSLLFHYFSDDDIILLLEHEHAKHAQKKRYDDVDQISRSWFLSRQHFLSLRRFWSMKRQYLSIDVIVMIIYLLMATLHAIWFISVVTLVSQTHLTLVEECMCLPFVCPPVSHQRIWLNDVIHTSWCPFRLTSFMSSRLSSFCLLVSCCSV